MNIKTTLASPFRSCGFATKNQHLFQVATGVDIADALVEASNLLDMVHDPIFTAGMGDGALEGNAAWLVLHAIESAKAVIESLAESTASASRKAEKFAKQEAVS